MKIRLFSILDSKAKAYLPPQHQPSTEMMERLFIDACNDPKHPFSKHPEDYTLFELGEFDDDLCVIELHEAKIPLMNGADVSTEPDKNDLAFTHERIDELASMIGDMANQLELKLEVHKQ